MARFHAAQRVGTLKKFGVRWLCDRCVVWGCIFLETWIAMAKPHRGLKKANHGARPANSKARKRKRRHVKT